MPADTDLQDALTAWQQGALPEARINELLERMRNDSDFRRQVADRVWMLSMIRIAQAPAPRWLELCAELGITQKTSGSTTMKLESLIMQQVKQRPLSLVRSWWRAAAIGTTSIAAALALVMVFEPAPEPTTFTVEPELKFDPVASVLQTTVSSVSADNILSRKGAEVIPGRYQIDSGSAVIMFKNGVVLQTMAPVDLQIIDAEHVFCRHGKVRTMVPKGAEGFVVEVPNGRVTDLGTEMGVNVDHDGSTRVAVFQGKAEAMLRLRDQDGILTKLVAAQEAVEILPMTGELKKTAMDGFLPLTELPLPDFSLRADYPEVIKKSGPVHYWRMTDAESGVVKDEMAGNKTLTLTAGVWIQADEMGRRTVEFNGESGSRAMYVKEPFALKRSGWAIELWFVNRSYDQAALASFTPAENDPNHIFISEFNTQIPKVERRRSVRFLARWPAATDGGVNLFSSPNILPFQWHHVVIQQTERKMQLWVDGVLAGKGVSDPQPTEMLGHLMFGATTIENRSTHKPETNRRLRGRMADLAIYDRTLSAEEIQQHASMVK